MYTFPQLIKKIRKEADMTQEEFAQALDVSTILIAMVEGGQREVSKNLLRQLADRLSVHPSSITPFLFADEKLGKNNLSQVEKKFIKLGEQLQDYLIKNRAKLLKKYAP
jgi:transcriptional regulator with XRE-family HTH domain